MLIADASNKLLEQMELAARVLLRQVNLVLDELLPVTVLIKGHNDDAILLSKGDLNVDPLVQR